MLACKSENYEEIKWLIDNGADVNMTNQDGNTSLIIAVKQGKDPLIIKYLIDKGADVNKINKDDKTSLIVAIEEDIDKEIIKILIDHKAALNMKNKDGNTPLMIAIEQKKDPLIIKYLINRGAFINIKNNMGNTPLIIACKNNMEEVIKYLLKEEVNITQRNKLNNTALDIIKNNKNYKKIEILLKEYESKLNDTRKNGDTLLTDACKRCYMKDITEIEEIIEYRIKTNINKKGIYDNKNFISSLNSCYTKVDINMKNKYGNTPLMTACYFINKKIVSYLINQEGTMIDIKDKVGNTPLMVACYFNNDSIIKILVERGAKINIKNSFGDSPISIIEKYRNYNILKYLMLNYKKESNKYTMHKTENVKKSKKNNEIDICIDQREEIFDQYYTYNENDPEKRKNQIMSISELTNVANKSVCIIKFKNKNNKYEMGTGFFIELQFENQILRGLMTNNHVLNENQLNIKNSQIFEIYFEQNKEKFDINSNDMSFIFTEELIDITFIQLSDKIIKKINPYYLTVDNKDSIEMEITTIIQYPIKNELLKEIKSNKEESIDNYNIQVLSIANGFIKYSSGINYCHTCSTFFASSGSPLINNSLKVIGVHKSSGENKNYATKISVAKYAIFTSYKRKYKNEISNTVGIVKELSIPIIKELKNHRLIQQKYENLFKFKGNHRIPSLYFYRTNHAWYWTDNNIDNIEDMRIKHLNWNIIVPHDQIDINNCSLIPIHQIIIMWLRLSEFMYL